ncbi:serine-type D-Ala-D-Ala carboxypeptidase [Gallibacterium trehalosifermentans]|uniref:Serine-type D-Ala-D-Ala carboxypeptidase n=1 Tax=Gallibacterium trehalosifermentans TaxID=516935 RepID=A0ABV6H2G9_9PAST
MFSKQSYSRFYKYRAILFLLFVSFTTHSFATIDVTPIIKELPRGASATIAAKNLTTGQITANYQSDIFMLPASTQKVFTALAAKLFLTDNFTFQTSLLTNGKIEENRLKGDLIVKFSGDPDLTSGQLYTLLANLKKRGVTQIDGNLILDTSIFSSHDRGLGWIWNDLTMCFNAPPAAVNIDSNCFSVNINANGPVGSLVKVDVPSQYPIQMFSQVYIVNDNEAGYCQFDVVSNDNNRYQLKGCIRRQPKNFNLSFAVQDTDSYATATIQRMLKNLGIKFSGQVQRPFQPQQGNIIATHQSKALPELLKKMMKHSDNQIADALFRTIAYYYYKRPATFQLGGMAIRRILEKNTHIRFGNSVIADGSGLSRQNLISANTMLQTLEFIAKNDNKLNLLQTFPIAGVDGTISGRGSLISPPLVKNVIAKTGSLKGVYNLAGFMTNARGEHIAFVQFVNGYSTGDLENKTKRAPLVRFESQLYQSLYSD